MATEFNNPWAKNPWASDQETSKVLDNPWTQRAKVDKGERKEEENNPSVMPTDTTGVVTSPENLAILNSYFEEHFGVKKLCVLKNTRMHMNKEVYTPLLAAVKDTGNRETLLTELYKIISNRNRCIEVRIYPSDNIDFKRNPILTETERYTVSNQRGEDEIRERQVKRLKFEKDKVFSITIMEKSGLALLVDPGDDRLFILINRARASTNEFDAGGGLKTTPSESATFFHELLDHGKQYMETGDIVGDHKSKLQIVYYHNIALENVGSPIRTGGEHD